MSRSQFQIKNVLTRCPHCGKPLGAQPGRERIRWYIADDGRTPSSASPLGAKLLDSLRENGQAVYVSPDGGKTMRRVGVATAADGKRMPAGEREPIILTPEEFVQHWRQAGPRKAAAARTFAAGGAR